MGARGGCARAPGAGGWTVRTGGRPTAKRRNARAEKGGERGRRGRAGGWAGARWTSESRAGSAAGLGRGLGGVDGWDWAGRDGSGLESTTRPRRWRPGPAEDLHLAYSGAQHACHALGPARTPRCPPPQPIRAQADAPIWQQRRRRRRDRAGGGSGRSQPVRPARRAAPCGMSRGVAHGGAGRGAQGTAEEGRGNERVGGEDRSPPGGSWCVRGLAGVRGWERALERWDESGAVHGHRFGSSRVRAVWHGRRLRLGWDAGGRGAASGSGCWGGWGWGGRHVGWLGWSPTGAAVLVGASQRVGHLGSAVDARGDARRCS